MEKIIKAYKEARQNNTEPEIKVCSALAFACCGTVQSGNKIPDFDEAIWDNEIEEIVADCRKYGIKEFTISSTFSSLIETLAKFQEFGCKIEGLTKVNSRFDDFATGGKEIKDAFRLSI